VCVCVAHLVPEPPPKGHYYNSFFQCQVHFDFYIINYAWCLSKSNSPVYSGSHVYFLHLQRSELEVFSSCFQCLFQNSYIAEGLVGSIWPLDGDIGQCPVVCYFMVNGLHLYSAFIQSALHWPLIHPFTHQWRQLPCKALACSLGAIWGSVSCPRTFRHVERGGAGIRTADPAAIGRPTLPPEPQLPTLHF